MSKALATRAFEAFCREEWRDVLRLAGEAATPQTISKQLSFAAQLQLVPAPNPPAAEIADDATARLRLVLILLSSACSNVRNGFALGTTPPRTESIEAMRAELLERLARMMDRDWRHEQEAMTPKLEALPTSGGATHRHSRTPGVHEWMPAPNAHNFGDHLVWLLGAHVFTARAWRSLQHQEDKSYILLGSAICDFVIRTQSKTRRQVVFVGCGYRGDNLSAECLAQAVVVGVRGPLSQASLATLGVSTFVSGDPAIALPLFLARNGAAGSSGRVFMPHIQDPRRLQYTPQEIGCDHIVQPETHTVQELVSTVAILSNASFVLGGAMHAAVVAYAYGVPFGFFAEGYLDCPAKWQDWCCSIGLSAEDARHYRRLDEAKTWYAEVEGRLRRPDAWPVLRAYRKVGAVRLVMWRKAVLMRVRAWIADRSKILRRG